MNNKILSKDGKEMLALALVLLGDLQKACGKSWDQSAKEVIELAQYLNLTEEYSKMLAQSVGLYTIKVNKP